MEKKIKVFVKNPGQVPHMEIVDNTLEALQKIVYGYIEVVQPFKDMALIVNEEGIILNMPYNCTYLGTMFFGPMVFVGVKGEDFANVPISLKDFKENNISLWEKEALA